MEHKVCTATRKAPKQELIHYCGSCGKYTENYEVDGVYLWGEHCLAGCSYEHMRHTVNCDKWERSPYA